MPRDAADLSERFRGCLLGVAAGDALEAPFLSQVDAEAAARWAASAAPLRGTDDTHMTLGVARSLLDCERIDGPRLTVELARTHDAEPWRGYSAGPPQVFAGKRLPSAGWSPRHPRATSAPPACSPTSPTSWATTPSASSSGGWPASARSP